MHLLETNHNGIKRHYIDGKHVTHHDFAKELLKYRKGFGVRPDKVENIIRNHWYIGGIIHEHTLQAPASLCP